MNSSRVPIWEAVHTVVDFHDRPLKGIADYRGNAHAYLREWDDGRDDWADTLLLSPISEEHLAAAKEQWQLWLNWRSAHDKGALEPEDKHPVLAADRSRYDALDSIVESAMTIDAAKSIKVLADFRGSVLSMGKVEVRWTDVC